MTEIIGGDPAFRDDDGTEDPAVAAVLRAYAVGTESEQAVLRALSASRLLVPVVAVLTEAADDGAPGAGGRAAGWPEKSSEMAMPTLIGQDGRSAIPAFTSADSMRRWQADARPVPVAASSVWQSAVAESCAVVVDVAGPVPFAVEGARLAALARGEAAPPPEADPDVREAVAAALAAVPGIGGCDLLPGNAEYDLVIGLRLTAEGAAGDVAALAGRAGDAVLTALGGRLRRGVAIGLLPAPAGGA